MGSLLVPRWPAIRKPWEASYLLSKQLLTSPSLCHLACITLAYITKAKLVHQGLLSTFHRPCHAMCVNQNLLAHQANWLLTSPCLPHQDYITKLTSPKQNLFTKSC
ncbi:hypothetical protein TIFTF001_054767 [Ficus carica]|uniref:Uncharacterized protein n=1 Tax=Ficus carica TaxID=3494 RepID=A0AA88ED82_FICCA|nr:hypothetical protein TIFTF001_054767 [Ficus carica]